MSKSIEINGTKLHEIGMKIEPYTKGTVASLSYPKNRINIDIFGDQGTLIVPSFLAVEMLRTGVLPTDLTVAVSIAISGKSRGKFLISEFVYPRSGMKEEITIHLKRTR